MCDLYMKSADGFVYTFSLASRGELDDFVGLREQILYVNDCEDVPIVLVGAFTTGDDKPRVVTTEQGQEMAKRFKCPFFEVDVGESDQVEAAVKAVLPMALTWRKEMEKKKNKKDHDCIVM